MRAGDDPAGRRRPLRDGRHRRSRRGRAIGAAGAATILVGSALPWYTAAGDLPVQPARAFDGSGILTFVAAVATLALVTLPWALPDRDDPDRPIAYALLAALAALGVALWPPDRLDRPAGLMPDRAPGLWLAVVGAAILAAAAWRVSRERAGRPGRRS